MNPKKDWEETREKLVKDMEEARMAFNLEQIEGGVADEFLEFWVKREIKNREEAIQAERQRIREEVERLDCSILSSQKKTGYEKCREDVLDILK